MHRIIAMICLFFAVGGCAGSAENPSFPLTSNRAETELKAMSSSPRPLRRPVVVVCGFLDAGVTSPGIAKWLTQTTREPGRILVITLFWCRTFEECREKIVTDVQKAFPSDDVCRTAEVDVIGLSMGGLAARYAALPAGLEPEPLPTTLPATAPVTTPTPACRYLNIHQLFTLASPHRGAVIATFPAINRMQVDMRKDSAFLNQLNALGSPPYPVIPYTRVPDGHVGSANTSLPGQTPIWMPNAALEDGHTGIPGDLRIIADIARRLRGEKPYATEPRSALPE